MASALPPSAMRTLATALEPASRPAAVPTIVDVAVVGAGVIGLSIAWRLAQRGLSVAAFDRAGIGAGASLAATGMLLRPPSRASRAIPSCSHWRWKSAHVA